MTLAIIVVGRPTGCWPATPLACSIRNVIYNGRELNVISQHDSKLINMANSQLTTLFIIVSLAGHPRLSSCSCCCSAWAELLSDTWPISRRHMIHDRQHPAMSAPSVSAYSQHIVCMESYVFVLCASIEKCLMFELLLN